MPEFTAKRTGDRIELLVAYKLLADPCLAVFAPLSDDGHGFDIAVYSSRTCRWFGVQVKAAKSNSNPCVYAARFRAIPDFLVAAVRLDDQCEPIDYYLVAGDMWAKDTSGCLGSNLDGGGAGPYYEIRTTAARHRSSLEAYRFEDVAKTL